MKSGTSGRENTGREVLETQKMEGITSICISPCGLRVFFPETSSFLRKKLQTGNTKIQVKPRGDRSLLTTSSEHAVLGAFEDTEPLLTRRFGEFLSLCVRRQAGCSVLLLFQLQSPSEGTEQQNSLAGHPGKSQSDRLARSSQAGTPAASNNCPEHFKKPK